MAIERNITSTDGWFTGTDKKLVFAVYKADKVTPEDVTIWDMSWMVKRFFTTLDADALVKKTTALGSLTITGVYNVDPVTNTQRVRCTVTDEDIAVLKAVPVKYYHELKRTEAGSEEILVYGTLELIQAVHIT